MKIEKERKIVKLMIELYYDKKLKHQFEDEKNDLIKYVNFRLDKCPFQDKKTFCSKCKIHCYQDAYKEKIKKVMRYSGPRMLFYHPVLLFKHLFTSGKSK